MNRTPREEPERTGSSVIGAASEFYRLRVTRLDETGAPDFEWRDDVLYRTMEDEVPHDRLEWAVEAVPTSDTLTGNDSRRFQSLDAARAFMDEAGAALRDMTKSQFEQWFRGGGESGA